MSMSSDWPQDHKELLLAAERLLRALLGEFSGQLDSASFRAVQHYLDHDEYEMAFEGLFIELMKANADMNKSRLETYYNLGQKLGLDKDSVFDGEFWKKFRTFVGQGE